ncbi:alpha/beta hydrolase [Nocardioides euryhalodurans]|uniref:Alpha/beta hydrolase n=1 Tax=Nocardioides euryhalodurans TaxID=2518370 RepID=A0A4V1BDW9_9ACTN|nr:alpha/beta hydrolase [Nocardioides euryhalodurans]QBR92582.1 alpha/beta hydrolase [Nocardioides euryhalodurans]
MPSRRHQLLARVVPRIRRAQDLVDEPTERARLERRHAALDPSLPTRLVPRFAGRFSVVTEELDGFPVHVITPRGIDPARTVVHVHGGGFIAPVDDFHVRYATRLALALGARVVMPDYPLAPEHSWRDTVPPLVELTSRWLEQGRVTLLGDSAGGGPALAIALALRDRGGPQPSELLLLSPWVDLTTSTPDTPAYAERDPWLFLGKVHAYAGWWAGSPDDLARPEVSPALGDLTGLPRALMFCGTRDLLVPGCRLLAKRAADVGWDLTYVEEPDLIHVFPILPLLPEARTAWRTTLEFLA